MDILDVVEILAVAVLIVASIVLIGCIVFGLSFVE